MSKTPAQISSDIVTKLGVTAPGLSLEIGTPERKIIDACAESISEGYMDTYLLNASLDIDTKSGTDLEQFVGIFGFGRLQGRRSTGVVTFSIGYPATQDMPIGFGVQVYVPANLLNQSTPLFFSTTQTVVISQGTTSVDAPAECTVLGTIGNAASNTITGFGTGTGVATVTNLAPFSGGTNTETDDQLRARFKATFLRNVTGTADFYSGLMLQSQFTSRVKIIGPYSNWVEELQFNGANKIFSTNQNVKYTWPNGWYLYQNLGLSTETFFTSGTDYTVDTTVTPPGITPSNAVLTAAGALADFEYQYTSTVSRNDPASGITNRVDIFIDGQQPLEVVEFSAASSQTFNTTTGSDYNINNFIRDVGGTPTSGHTFQALGSVPIITFPSVITSQTNTYNLGTDYHGVTSTTLLQGSNREISGIEWLTTPPTAGTLLTIDYSYNRLPELMTGILNANKQICTDVVVHQAINIPLFVYATIAYNFGANITTTNANISSALTTFFSGLPFGAWIQFSDVIQQIHNVVGVDNVRISTLTDVGGSGSYGIAYRQNSVVITDYTADFKLKDNQVALFDGISIVRRGSNNF